MKKITFLIFALCIFILTNCGKTENTVNTEMTVSAVMSGANQIPATASTGSGSVSGKYDKTTKILTITITYTGVQVVSCHIHKGAAGVNGGHAFDLVEPFASPIRYTSPAFTASQEADLLAGNNYVNLHSSKFPDGELRGQLKVQ